MVPSARIAYYSEEKESLLAADLTNIPKGSSVGGVVTKLLSDLLTGDVSLEGPTTLDSFGFALGVRKGEAFVSFSSEVASAISISGNIQGSCGSASCPIYSYLTVGSGRNLLYEHQRGSSGQRLYVPGTLTVSPTDSGLGGILATVLPYEESVNDARVAVENKIRGTAQALGNAAWSFWYHGLTSRIMPEVFVTVA